MKEITLTQGKVALVDDEDFEELSKYRWSVCKKGRNNWYARRHQYVGPGKYAKVYMHKHIMNETGLIVDHINGNSLNNQRSNLRYCTQAQNAMNSRHQEKCASKFKGVSKHIRFKTWQAAIVYQRKRIWLGCHGCEEAAALAYNKKAVELFGEFARLNSL